MEQFKQQKNYDDNAFGKYVRMRREKLGLSCRQLAKKLGMTPSYLSDIENGIRKAPTRSLKGRDYMAGFIKYLQIRECDVVFFYELALASRDFDPCIRNYIKFNTSAKTALHLAKEVNLSDEEWKKIINYIVETKINSEQ